MSNSLRSLDPAAHASIGSTLTDRQIDAYMLRGHYGERSRQKLLRLIKSGTVKSLDARIRTGEFGPEAKRALNARPVRKKRTTPKATLTQSQLEEFAEFLGISSNLLDCSS